MLDLSVPAFFSIGVDSFPSRFVAVPLSEPRVAGFIGRLDRDMEIRHDLCSHAFLFESRGQGFRLSPTDCFSLRFYKPDVKDRCPLAFFFMVLCLLALVLVALFH